MAAGDDDRTAGAWCLSRESAGARGAPYALVMTTRPSLSAPAFAPSATLRDAPTSGATAFDDVAKMFDKTAAHWARRRGLSPTEAQRVLTETRADLTAASKLIRHQDWWRDVCQAPGAAGVPASAASRGDTR